MAITNAGMQLMAGALRTGWTHVQLHSADPGADGAGFEVGSRAAVTWNAVAGDGDFDLASTVEFTSLGANQAVTHISGWSADTNGTCYAVQALSGDQAANAAGAYNLTEITVNGTAT